MEFHRRDYLVIMDQFNSLSLWANPRPTMAAIFLSSIRLISNQIHRYAEATNIIQHESIMLKPLQLILATIDGNKLSLKD